MKSSKLTTNKLTLHARKSIAHAEKIAHANDSQFVQPEHLLYGIFLERGCVGSTILRNIGLSKTIIEKNIFSEKPKTKSTKKSQIQSSEVLKKMIIDAHALASEFGYNYVGTEHLIYALLNSDIIEIQEIITQAKPKKQPNQNSIPSHAHPQGGGLFGIENLAALMGEKEVVSDSAIDQFCTYISQEKSEPFIGRQSDIDRITTILGRRNKNNPLIVGEPGIGKTAIIEHIAHLAKSPEAPHYLYGKEIVTLDLTLLVAGTSFRGEFEQRLKAIVNEAQENPHIILFIDEIHTIIGTGNTGGSLDAANILKPALARGSVRIIGATTFGEYKKHIEKDPALERRFQKVIMREPTATEARKIIDGVHPTLEEFHDINISEEALDAAVSYAERYLHEQNFPDKALDVIDETSARLCSTREKKSLHKNIISLEKDLSDISSQKTSLIREERYGEASHLRDAEDALTEELKNAKAQIKNSSKDRISVGELDIAQTIALHTNIPYEKILQKDSSHIASAQEKLRKNVIGQDHALEKITDTLMRSSSGISNENRPNGSFLFLGSTGIGKTFTATVLAQEIYNDPESLIRVDMSELMEKHHTSKLLGAPAGYVGYGEGGVLTEKIRRNPHSVVLFDEIEKAHPDVFNILLQVLEDGKITDAAGREINFKNTIIILTSNAGNSDLAQEKNMGFEKKAQQDTEVYEKKTQSAVKEILPPELLSRLDHIIVFNQLHEQNLRKIARAEINNLKKRLKKKNIALTATARLINHIAKTSQEKNGGARGIRQFIQEHIEGVIAQHIIENSTCSKVSLDYIHDAIIVS